MAVSIFIDNPVLLKDFRQGKKQVLHDVYHRYVDTVEIVVRNGFISSHNQKTIRGITSSETQKELIQEIFVRAFSQNARLAYDGIRPFKAFLLTIARNVMIDHIRKVSRDAMGYATYPDDKGEPPVPLQADPGDKTEEREERLYWDTCFQSVAGLLPTFNAMERQFVQLRFVEEISQRDVADKMKITRWRARVLEQKITKRVRAHLQKEGLWQERTGRI